MLYVMALNVCTYCILFVLALKKVLSYWCLLYEHPYCTDSDILLFLLPTNVLIVRHFGSKRRPNVLNVNVNYMKKTIVE